jgi:hypothetical protein
LENLDQVRKGKPRKFVMLCKGPKIIGLVVFKKGPYEKHIKAAKKASGSGMPFYGVIEGRGPNINFKLSRADGFDKEPVKTTVLRTFLADEADYKAMPVIEIVSELGPVLDADDPLVQRFTKLQQAALAACEAHPGRADEINQACLAIGKHFDADEPKEAEAKLAALEKLLQSLVAGDTPTGGTTTETTTEPGPEKPVELDPKLLQQLTDEVKRLQVETDIMAKAGVGDTAAIKSIYDGIANDRQEGDLEAALDTCRSLVQFLEREWTDQSRDAAERVEDLLSGAFTERGGDVEKIKTVLNFAQERAADNRHGSALVALKNLRSLLDAAEGPDAKKEADVIEKGTVAERKKFVESRWQGVMRQVSVEVDKLRPAVSISVAEEPPNELADAIQEYIDDFLSELSDAIMNVKKAGDDDRKPIEKALALIKSYRQRIPGEPMIQHLNESRESLGVDVDVEARLLEALQELEERLSEPVGAS